MVEIVPVLLDEKEVLRNLLEKYEYEFSQWCLTDVNDSGLYGYEYLDCYWTEARRFPYFIRMDGRLAGFVMVNDYPEAPEHATDFCMAEFFVMHKYRRQGVGREAVFQVLDRHHGSWQLKRHPHNLASVYFWNRVIDEYTSEHHTLIEAYPNHDVDYEDGTPADIFYFEN